jgi:hypothetical protein
VKTSFPIKIAIGLAAIAAFGWLFMRSIQDTQREPYRVPQANLQPATLAIEPASRPIDPLLVLRPVPDLATGLFKQIFSRAMESLNSPTTPSIPVVLRGEFDRTIADRLTQDALLSAAKNAGIDKAALSPRCLVHRRISEPGGVRQAYLVLFDAPAIVEFRRQLGLEADTLSPIMFIAGAGSDFASWLPQRIHTESDCLAPIEVVP